MRDPSLYDLLLLFSHLNALRVIRELRCLSFSYLYVVDNRQICSRLMMVENSTMSQLAQDVILLFSKDRSQVTKQNRQIHCQSEYFTSGVHISLESLVFHKEKIDL